MFPIFFHGNGVRTAECISAAVRLFPQEAKTADAVCRSGLACEKKNSGKSADFPELRNYKSLFR